MELPSQGIGILEALGGTGTHAWKGRGVGRGARGVFELPRC